MPEEKKKVPRKIGDPPPEGDGSDTSPPGSEGDGGEKPYEFSDPALKDKSPAEIEDLFRMSQRIVSSQKTKLDAATTRVAELSKDPAPVPVGEKKGFFDDPDAAFARLEKRMTEQIEPLRRELQAAKVELGAAGVFDNLRREFADWDSVYPYVKHIIDGSDPPFPNPSDEGLLRNLYYTAVGMMHKKGVLPTETKPPADGDTPPPDRSGAPPQHRSSPPPPPPKQAKKEAGVTWDDLDESEKTLCKFYKMDPEEFREFGGINAEDVIGSQIGQKAEA
ncbi:hypothetical protein LCGC14_2117150 [marine sediment metagenome]|uniref:Uncharacterized protein n=1 Tax=marine sediment metagenome TaxID=412755 RepID=A0A0F9H1K5_9ZZZZ